MESGDLWADVVLHDEGWQYTIGNKDLILSRESLYRSPHACESAMERAWQRLKKGLDTAAAKESKS